MTDTTKQDHLAEMAAFCATPKRVTVGDKDYDLAKLSPLDLAEARDYVVQSRIEHFLSTTRHMPLDPATRAQTLALIECTPLSVFEVTHNAGGRLKLIHISVTRAGGVMPLDQLRQGLKPASQDELYAWCMWISGCLPDIPLSDGEADDGPLSIPADTTPTPP